MGLFEKISQTEKCILDLVTFEKVLIKYNKNFNLYVNFKLDPELKGSTFDWIGIFKCGWDKYESFLAFEWGIGEPISDCGTKRRLIFHTNYLKSAQLNTNYQFVYISKNLEILGVSQFFQFIDDIKNDSFCLNASYLLQEDVSSSTEIPINTDNSLNMQLAQKVSPVKRARPNCSLNVPNNWEQIFTTCWKCKSLFEMKNKHNELIAKLNSYSEQTEKLKERLNNLELALANIWNANAQTEPWDDKKERVKFKRFVSSVMSSSGIGDHHSDKKSVIEEPKDFELPPYELFSPSIDGKNELPLKSVIDDHGRDKRILFQMPYDIESLPYDRFPHLAAEGSNNHLELKAIIGSQEDTIRELTNTIIKMQNTELPIISRSKSNMDIVKLVTVTEKIVPEFVKVDSENDDKESVDENGNIDVNNKEHGDYLTQQEIGQEMLKIPEAKM